MDARKWVAVAGTMLGAFMAVLDTQITNSSLADISGGIAATPDEGSWISTAYLIGEIITIPLTAWLGGIFTLRWYLLGNVVLFLFFSGMCGISHTLGEMIVFRVGQGFTGGVFIPTALTVVVTMMPRNLQPVGTAMFGLTATLAPAVGPYIGGWLTDRVGWEWNFYINFIPGILMFATVAATIPAEKMQLGKLKQGDCVGIASLAIGLGSLVAMLEEGQRHDWFGSAFIRNCGILAAIFVPIFVVWELFVAKEPLVKLRLLGSRNLAVSTLLGFVLGLGLYGCVYLIPEYLGTVQGYSPLLIGETLIWVGLPQLFVFPFLPFLMKKVDMRMLIFVGSLGLRLQLLSQRVHDPGLRQRPVHLRQHRPCLRPALYHRAGDGPGNGDARREGCGRRLGHLQHVPQPGRLVRDRAALDHHAAARAVPRLPHRRARDGLRSGRAGTRRRHQAVLYEPGLRSGAGDVPGAQGLAV